MRRVITRLHTLLTLVLAAAGLQVRSGDLGPPSQIPNLDLQNIPAVYEVQQSVLHPHILSVAWGPNSYNQKTYEEARRVVEVAGWSTGSRWGGRCM